MQLSNNPFDVVVPSNTQEESTNSFTMPEPNVSNPNPEQQSFTSEPTVVPPSAPNNANTAFGSSGGSFFSNPNPQNINNQHTQQNQQSPKYVITDFYWIINSKLYNNKALDPGETPILVLSYNASFNNLRVCFRTADENAFTASSIIISNTKQVTSFNLFSEHCIDILNSKESGQHVRIFERVFKNTTNWNPNITQILWSKEGILFKTQTQNNETYSFTMKKEDTLKLETALKYMVNGQAWNTALQYSMQS